MERQEGASQAYETIALRCILRKAFTLVGQEDF
jgi:hypothetical protein